jgi:hypothetical protein
MLNQVNRITQDVLDNARTILSMIYLYFAIIGLFGFALFICEEAIQSIQFANFSCKDSGRYDMMKENLEKIEQINGTIKLLNGWLMWLNPIQKWAYADYALATDRYLETIHTLVMAMDPGLYAGELITFPFYYKRVKEYDNYKTLTTGLLSVDVPLDFDITGNPVDITGVIQPFKGRYIFLLQDHFTQKGESHE